MEQGPRAFLDPCQPPILCRETGGTVPRCLAASRVTTTEARNQIGACNSLTSTHHQDDGSRFSQTAGKHDVVRHGPTRAQAEPFPKTIAKHKTALLCT